MKPPSWQNVLPNPQPGGRLHEAWLTTFERPDASLLVEHLLPSLLGGTYSPSQELPERTLFFGELSTKLEELRGRLTLISSPPRAAREDLPYPWIWRYVSHFIVGAKSRAVQHSKLWAFHWKIKEEDFLELHVSSTNLTTSAFKDQLQAGWRVMLLLGPRASLRTGKTWGSLIPFLNALGESAGNEAEKRIQRLMTLLRRAECPSDITFVASIPGQKRASRQIKQLEPSELHVLTPTIGEWNDRRLKAWCEDAGLMRDKIHLKWISKQHPWKKGWALSGSACATLEKNGVRLKCLPTEVNLTDEHRGDDPRWSHAKLYLLKFRRKKGRLLVTSANWSVAAWGAGNEAVKNFELGVLFDSEWIDLEDLGKPFDLPDTSPFCVDRADEEDNKTTLWWAEASWDANSISLSARSAARDAPITTIVNFAGNTEIEILLDEHGNASILWNDPEHTPLTARFAQGKEVLVVDVLDLRPPTAFAKTPLPEVDPTEARALREAFLLQRYGGPAVDPEMISGLRGPRKPTDGSTPVADYSVQAWLDARAAFNVVDQWRSALRKSENDSDIVERVLLDGKELHSLYSRCKGPAAELVTEELGWRLGVES